VKNPIAPTWRQRADRGAEERLAMADRRAPLVQIGDLKRDPHLEMHTRGGDPRPELRGARRRARHRGGARAGAGGPPGGQGRVEDEDVHLVDGRGVAAAEVVWREDGPLRGRVEAVEKELRRPA